MHVSSGWIVNLQWHAQPGRIGNSVVASRVLVSRFASRKNGRKRTERVGKVWGGVAEVHCTYVPMVDHSSLPFFCSPVFSSPAFFFFFLTWNCRVGRIEWKSGTWYGGWGIHCFLTGVLHCLFWVRIIGLFERDLCIIVRQESNEKLVKGKKYEISIRKIVNFFFQRIQ